MKNLEPTARGRRTGRDAFTVVEVMMAAMVITVAVTTIFTSMITGYSMTAISRENLRATQIMLDKMEAVRLYNWSQITNAGPSTNYFLNTVFTNWFYETNNIGEWNAMGNGVQYTGMVSVVSVPWSNIYSSTMVEVDVNIGWNSSGNGWYHGTLQHTRSMSTYVSMAGMQNYIYNSN